MAIWTRSFTAAVRIVLGVSSLSLPALCWGEMSSESVMLLASNKLGSFFSERVSISICLHIVFLVRQVDNGTVGTDIIGLPVVGLRRPPLGSTPGGGSST